MSDWADPTPEPPPATGPIGDPGSELVEWVEPDGSVIEVVTRARMRAEGLRHRCTYVVVVVGPTGRFAGRGAADQLDPDTEVVVHKRADWKDVSPGHWDLAFGGVCGVGEDWGASARRELAEEAGIDLAPGAPLIDLGPTFFREPPADPDRHGPVEIVGRAFLVAWPHRPVSTDGEAVAFDRVPLGRLRSWLQAEQVCADSATVVAPLVLARLGSTGPVGGRPRG